MAIKILSCMILLWLSSCAQCKTSTMRCKDRKAQVCMDKKWVTARECETDCYMKDGWPTCLK
jgi:hypothetical protein